MAQPAKAESGYPAQAAPKPENSPDPKPAPREIPDITKDSPQPNAKDPVKAGQGDSNQGRK
ncbi:MAG TPA: hypothetical protein VFW49_12790 [Fluviicoccus sp.]|nr:hypothetical protein [Fluviicoccus sp.]